MQSKMPPMPGLPGQPQKLSSEDSAESPAESDMSLDVPSHEEFKKPELITPESDSNSVMTVPEVPVKGIEVVATRDAFYNQVRIAEGKRLFIKSEQDFGDWMKCVEPGYEKKRKDIIESKRAKK